MNLSLLGFGGVGKAFIRLLIDKKDELEKQGLELNIKYILNSKGGIYNPKGIKLEEVINISNLSDHRLWKEGMNYKESLNKDEVDLMVELTPTNKETGEPGVSHIRYALENSINVVTGNKGPILVAYNELKDISLRSNVSFALGCTTGGALPSLNCGLIDLAGATINSIEGILNGTSNFILDEMENKNISFEEALKLAQSLGIAETDPALDVEGWDTAIKMVIMAKVIMKEDISLKDVYIKGINNLTKQEVQEAKSQGKKFKLVGKIYNEKGKISIEVKPELIEEGNILATINGKNKGLRFSSDTLGEVIVIGGASGTINAAASILRDIINMSKGYKF